MKSKFICTILLVLFLSSCSVNSGSATEIPQTTSALPSESMTTAATYLYYGASEIPGFYKIPLADADSETAAARILAEKMLRAMKEADPNRSFCLTEYKNLALEVVPSALAADRTQDWGISADSALITDHTWLVYLDVSFRFTGIYAPIGPSIGDQWWNNLTQGSARPLILMKTENVYLLWWASAYNSGIPTELEGELVSH